MFTDCVGHEVSKHTCRPHVGYLDGWFGLLSAMQSVGLLRTWHALKDLFYLARLSKNLIWTMRTSDQHSPLRTNKDDTRRIWPSWVKLGM